jgi:hypothetical protein
VTTAWAQAAHRSCHSSSFRFARCSALSVLRRGSPSRFAASAVDQPANAWASALRSRSLNWPASRVRSPSRSCATSRSRGSLAVGDSGERASGLIASCGLAEWLVLGPSRRGERTGELAGDAQCGERPEAGAAAAAVEADGLHEADARLLGDVVGVAARQVEARSLALEQSLVAAQ